MGEYFSKDLCDLILGRITSKEFTDTWGEVSYDPWTARIFVGKNFISTDSE